MRCPVCGNELAAPQTACPRCGSFLGGSLGGRAAEPPHTFRVLLAGSLIVLAALGGVVYHFASKSNFFDFFRNTAFSKALRQRAVVHGGVANPDELQHYGKLYFVPMGRQAFPVESLAAYYRDKFKIEITVLAEVPIDSASYDSPRGQYVADDMILDMKRAYPKIAAAADSVMIILTDEDIYPRSLGWKFTYSYRSSYKFAVVSSRRNDPAFWDSRKPHDPAVQLAGFKQMLTKYIALTYFHLPHSYDPTSVMYQPLTPDGGSDDLYESDLHPEESANGFRGSGWPCLIYSYDYQTGKLRHLDPSVQECGLRPVPASPEEEVFFTQFSTGEFFGSALDFQLDSTPPIEFHRVYRSQYHQRWALGLSTNDNYNTWLYSDGGDKYSFIDIIREDDNRDHFVRMSPGTGFSPTVSFENHDSNQELYDARLTWEEGHYKLHYRDGAWSTFLNCSDGRCYWNGYQDSAGHLLRFDRDAALNLRKLTASDHQGIDFESDSKFRLTGGKDTSGNQVSYAYDAIGHLVRVGHADGQVTVYSYDSGHRLTAMVVFRTPGDSAVTVFTNEYDTAGRVIRQTLADGGVFQVEYSAGPGQTKNVKLTEPSGRVLEITRPSDYDYVVRTTPIRFPAVLASGKPAIQ